MVDSNNRWRIDVDRGDPWAENSNFSRSDWGAEAEANDTNLGYWEWVYNNRSLDKEAGETVPAIAKDDVLRAIANVDMAKAQLNEIGRELICADTLVYWYTQRGQSYYRQDGIVLHSNSFGGGGSTEIKVRNTHTEKEYFISLWDLRFWLNDTHPTED